MKLRKETRTNKHQSGQNITKGVLVITDGNDREVIQEDWDNQHPM